MRVEDVMRTDVTTVEPSTSLRDVARTLAERRISGVPVMGSDGAVLGVVSEEDILMKERGPELGERSWLGRLFDPPDPQATAKLAAQTAGEAMTSPAITIEPSAPLARAAATMSDRGVNRLPVVSGGTLVGIVARADIVRAFTRSDEEIAREIREDVVLRTFWQEPESVAVTVDDGRVTLAGSMDRRSLADVLVAFVERVPGVVAVDSRLTWQEDDRR